MRGPERSFGGGGSDVGTLNGFALRLDVVFGQLLSGACAGLSRSMWQSHTALLKCHFAGGPR